MVLSPQRGSGVGSLSLRTDRGIRLGSGFRVFCIAGEPHVPSTFYRHYTPHEKVKSYLLYYEEDDVRSSVLPGFKVWCWEFRYS